MFSKFISLYVYFTTIKLYLCIAIGRAVPIQSGRAVPSQTGRAVPSQTGRPVPSPSGRAVPSQTACTEKPSTSSEASLGRHKC